MRGALIIVEGCDRCGKTTQCRSLVGALNRKRVKADYMHFPDRSTTIGKVIDDYLSKRVEVHPKAVHLLFSANRWELEPEIKKTLASGTTLVIDRYSYSGVAYSSIKPEMNIDWCKNVETGLPKPDLVLYLNLPYEESHLRPGYGEERYEIKSTQKAVSAAFEDLKDPTWKVVDANKSESALTAELLEYALDAVKAAKDMPLSELCDSSESEDDEDPMEK